MRRNPSMRHQEIFTAIACCPVYFSVSDTFSEHTLTFNSINRSFYFLLYFAQQHFLPKHKNVVSRGIFKWLNVYNLNKPSGNKSVFISIILNMYDATNMAQNFAKIAMLRRSVLQNDYSETHNSASQNNDRI